MKKLLVIYLLILSSDIYSQYGWETQLFYADRKFFDVSFIDTQTGWVCGRNDITGNVFVLVTFNGGDNWSNYSPPAQTGTLTSIHFISGGTGWTFGSDCPLYYTTNYGLNWSQQIAAPSALFKAAYIDNNTIVAANSQGRILKTTNGGVNWIDYSFTSNLGLLDISFSDAQNGWLEGINLFPDYGLYKTTDGGQSWTNVYFTNFFNLAVKFINSQTGWVGSNNNVYKTTDSGLNWTVSNSGVQDIHAFHTFNSQEILAAGFAHIKKSSDGGSNWVEQTIQGGNQLEAFSFANALTGWMVGDAIIYKTTNGGVVPVELSSFNSSTSENNVVLKWSTVYEENNSGFDIERKKINSAWIKIGNVQGNGTTNNVQNYKFEDSNIHSGKYNYRLKQIDYNGNFKFYDLSNEVLIGTPEKFVLSQNYPNPFNPTTTINYELPSAIYVSIRVFDMMGREVANLINGYKEAGYYSIKFDGSGLSNGIYYYKIKAGDFTAVKKIVLVK